MLPYPPRVQPTELPMHHRGHEPDPADLRGGRPLSAYPDRGESGERADGGADTRRANPAPDHVSGHRTEAKTPEQPVRGQAYGGKPAHGGR